MTRGDRAFIPVSEEVEKDGATYWAQVTRGSPYHWRIARRNPMGTVPMETYPQQFQGTANSYRDAVDAAHAALRKATT